MIVPAWKAERSARFKELSLLNHPAKLKLLFEPIRELEGDAKFQAAVQAVADILGRQKHLLAAELKPSSPGITVFIGFLFEDEYLPTGRREGDILRLIDQAKEDWRAYHVLRWVAEDMRQDLQAEALKRWRRRDWGGHIPVPKRKSGQLEDYYRKEVIVRMIEALGSAGFDPTRNKTAAPKSACDVLEQAAGRVGLGSRFTFDGLETIWKRNRRKEPNFVRVTRAMIASGLGLGPHDEFPVGQDDA